MLPGFSPDIQKYALIGVGGFHDVSEKIENRLFIRAVVEDVDINHTTGMTEITCSLQVSFEIEMAAPQAGRGCDRELPTTVS